MLYRLHYSAAAIAAQAPAAPKPTTRTSYSEDHDKFEACKIGAIAPTFPDIATALTIVAAVIFRVQNSKRRARPDYALTIQ